MGRRLGTILVDCGALTEAQVSDVLREQARTGRPFGLISEATFGVPPAIVEHAWAAQLAEIAERVDLDREHPTAEALSLVSRRQAWQFRVLPLRLRERELVVATSACGLRRASRFVTNVIGRPVDLVLADESALVASLDRHYPMAGLGPGDVASGPELDAMLARRMDKRSDGRDARSAAG